MVCFLSLTQTAEIAIFTFPGILCLAECFFLAEYLLQESVQPFAKLVFEESEVVDRYLGLSRRSHFDDRGVAFGSCPVDVEQGRGYLQRLLAAEDSGVQKRLENIVGTLSAGVNSCSIFLESWEYRLSCSPQYVACLLCCPGGRWYRLSVRQAFLAEYLFPSFL